MHVWGCPLLLGVVSVGVGLCFLLPDAFHLLLWCTGPVVCCRTSFSRAPSLRIRSHALACGAFISLSWVVVLPLPLTRSWRASSSWDFVRSHM